MPQRFFFRKEERLSQKKIIQKLFQEGIKVHCYPYKIFILKVEKSLTGRFQILITVPKKQFKRAVDRNLIKRRIREAYRLNKYILTDVELKPDMQIAIAFVYSPAEIHDHGFMQVKMIESLNRIKEVCKEKSI